MASGSDPIQLLVVDDDDPLRQAIVQRFSRLGMAVSQAASAEEALAQADRHDFDVALLDLNLPGVVMNDNCISLSTTTRFPERI